MHTHYITMNKNDKEKEERYPPNACAWCICLHQIASCKCSSSSTNWQCSIAPYPGYSSDSNLITTQEASPPKSKRKSKLRDVGYNNQTSLLSFWPAKYLSLVYGGGSGNYRSQWLANCFGINRTLSHSLIALISVSAVAILDTPVLSVLSRSHSYHILWHPTTVHVLQYRHPQCLQNWDKPT